MSYTPAKRRTTPPFQVEDRRRTILAPYFAPFYSGFIAAPFEAMGYAVEVLSPSDRESLEWGLKYTNNEICYPAILVIGDVIKALRSGRYATRDVAIGLTQTGGQCRASNYVPLLKKALVAAGFGDVPAIAVSTSGQNQNAQPGFDVSTTMLLRTGLWAIAFGDALSRMYYSTSVRELDKGAASELVEKYSALAYEPLRRSDADTIVALLTSAVEEFNRVPVRPGLLPKIGIVGEIYVKYNDFSNNFLIRWLQDQGVEVELPPLIDFFTQYFVNVECNTRCHLDKPGLSTLLASFFERAVQHRLDRIETVLRNYVRYKHQTTLRELSSRASRVLSLADQFGEGWLIPAEISSLAEEGVNNVICLQPFGCIANHIVAKGIEKRMRDLYPGLNLLYLDMDAGAGDANLHNRLHFMMQGAREERGHTGPTGFTARKIVRRFSKSLAV
ncbi:MAG: 2-hydroxyacyl-CoA dehydratase [Bacteroidetes bacterium]|nr:2-hydroxyacyl-CoA dehydratase [Bacteroidota bacterium]